MQQAQVLQSQPRFFLWYAASIKKTSETVWLLVLKNLDYFSIPLLFKTLFSPWKRDVISTKGLSLNEKFRIWIFNLLSRLIGAVVRLVTIFFGLFLTVFLLVFGLVAIIFWSILPFLILAAFVYGLILIVQG